MSSEMQIIMIIIMEISTVPYLLKNLQPKAHTKAIQTTITTHRRTCTHTHTHTHTCMHARIHAHTHTHTYIHTLSHMSVKNYMPPKYTCQKAENQTIGASFALSLSLFRSLSLLTDTQVQVTYSFTGGKVG